LQFEEIPVKKTPPGWPRISTALYYDDPAPAIDWLCEAFGFEIRLKIQGEGGRIEHSELTYGEGVIMVAGSAKESKPGRGYRRTPSALGGANTQNMMVYIDDVEAHCAKARAAGAIIVSEPTTTDHGEDYWTDRSYEAKDVGGHHWWFCQRLRDPKTT
jgi:uncharacterized glyoxalase superfamily protein PhnB